VAPRDIDILQQLQTVMGDYRWIGPFLLHWDLGNRIAEQCEQLAELLMSFLIGFFVAVFGFDFRFDSGYLIQVFMLVVDVINVFRASPPNCFTGAATGARISDRMLMAVAMAVLRNFVLLQFEPFRIRSHGPQTALVIATTVVFLFLI
jgi:hypothetical protein